MRMSDSPDAEKSGGVPNRIRRVLRGPRPEAVPTAVGTACMLIGLVDLVFPRLKYSKVHALAELLPGAVSSLAAAASIVVGLLLLMLAHGLKRRKRRAWGAAVALPAGGGAAPL